MATGGQQIGENWYFLDPYTGAMGDGRQQIGGNWYFFDPTTGVMLVNTTTPDGYWVDEKRVWVQP